LKILYIATSFPEPNKGATIYTDLAEALHEAGHEITVVASEQKRNRTETSIGNERGFKVLRVVTGNYYDVGLIEKGLTTLRLPALMKKGIHKYITEDGFDFVLYEAPPVTNGNLVSWTKRKFKCASYLMLKDIFPQNAVDLGMIKKNSILHKYFSLKEKQLYNSADIIGCMSQANIDYVLTHNKWLDKEKVELFPNTKSIAANITSNGMDIRKKFGINREQKVFLFGGNMGKPQYIHILSEAIINLQSNKDIYFLFVGRGTERHVLEETIRSHSIRNAKVVENLPRDEYEEVIKECDVGFIILDPRFTIPNYPSRILSYMEYAKPVLVATDINTDIKELVEKANCGHWIHSADTKEFICKIEEMRKMENLKEMGENGREYLEKNFPLSRSIKILESHYNKRS
jgi:glycosyltransferase involved in cell wall biosynthesis